MPKRSPIYPKNANHPSKERLVALVVVVESHSLPDAMEKPHVLLERQRVIPQSSPNQYQKHPLLSQ
jgi:DNA primase